MIFTSFNYLIWLIVIVTIYYIIPHKYRWSFLLFASALFYVNMKPIYALLLLGVSATTYLCGRWIDGTTDDKKRGNIVTLSIILVLLPLVFFKYLNSINNAIVLLLNKIGIDVGYDIPQFLLPIGISFYTFMAIGYLVDLYNEDIKVEKNFGILSLFISFFPLVLSGPIERAPHMLPQFRKKIVFSGDQIVCGLKLILWGYFMKLCVADRIAIYNDAIFNNIENHNGTTIMFASLLYPIQLYGDLGGYSLIAIGTAALLGLNVNPNFKRPFFATSMSEFWRRWHISLIKWLTDYIYTPISFNLRKYKINGIVFSLLITFIISGLWHGATLPFIVWGLVQGIFLSTEAILQSRRIKIETRYNLGKNVIYLTVMISITYILFSFSQIFGYSGSLDKAFDIINKIVTSPGRLFIDIITFFYLAISLPLLILKDFRDEFFPNRFLLFENKNIVIRYLSYLIILMLIILIGVLNSSQFIYFQF